MFDPPRQSLISKVCYNLLSGDKAELKRSHPAFQEDNSYRERFIGILNPAEMMSGHNGIVKAITDAIIRIVVEDQTKFLASINKALDDIELSMGKDLDVPQGWRDHPPRWRNHLFHQSETIAYFVALSSPESVASSSRSHAPAQDRALKRWEKRLEATTRRLEGTYQVLMSAMSILESERAIEQAEVVTRLTNLAFFFIPLTFVAGLFGMNVVEFDQKLTVGMWVGISAGVTALTYSIRFRRPLAAAAYQTPNTIRRLRWDMLIARMRRWTQVLRSLLPRLAAVALYAALGVAFWLAATLPSTDDAKIGISVSLQAVPRLLNPSLPLGRSYRELRPVQHAVVAAFLAGVGVALWALATSALPVDSKIGLALGIIAIPAFSTSASFRIATNPIFGGRVAHPFFFYSEQVMSEESLADRCRRSLIAILADGATAAAYSALGIALWKLFVSSLSDAAKIGVSVGAIGVPLMILQGSHFGKERPVQDSGEAPFRPAFMVIRKVMARLGGLSILAMAIWKVSTASSLSVSAKLGIGLAILSAGSFPLAVLLLFERPGRVVVRGFEVKDEDNMPRPRSGGGGGGDRTSQSGGARV
jgi:hypothetical protein